MTKYFYEPELYFQLVTALGICGDPDFIPQHNFRSHKVHGVIVFMQRIPEGANSTLPIFTRVHVFRHANKTKLKVTDEQLEISASKMTDTQTKGRI